MDILHHDESILSPGENILHPGVENTRSLGFLHVHTHHTGTQGHTFNKIGLKTRKAYPADVKIRNKD